MVVLNTVFTCINKSILRPNFVTNLQKQLLYHHLLEIGHFDPLKAVTNYATGQMFVHKVFGYRGVILFPWIAQVYDRDIVKVDNIGNMAGEDGEMNYKQTYYYQVLIDSRDIPFTRIKNEPVPFLNKLDKSLYAVPGVDYAAHEDILPYTATQKQNFQHDLIENFFLYQPDKDPCFEATDLLKSWQDKNRSRLKLTAVHKETTENVKVSVLPFFVGYRKLRRYVIFWWRFSVRLENLSDPAVTVRSHNWRIFSMPGSLESKIGSGVAGIEPTLDQTLPVFQYSGYVSLHSPSGHMWGTFEMEREDGSTFECRVPLFMLQSEE